MSRRAAIVAAIVALALPASAAARWDPTPPNPAPFNDGRAVALLTGDVLLFGASDGSSSLYHPNSNTFTLTGRINVPTAGGTTAVAALNDGRVLIAGGYQGTGGSSDGTSRAELYNPATGAWTLTSPMGTARRGAVAATLHDGRVLVVGGEGEFSHSPEIYNPATGAWSPASDTPVRALQGTATTLRSGLVLVTGYDENIQARADLYDPVANSWRETGRPIEGTLVEGGRHGLERLAALLGNGKVFVNAEGFCRTGENDPSKCQQPPNQVYDPASETWGSTFNREGLEWLVPVGAGKLVYDSGQGCRTYDPYTNESSPLGTSGPCGIFHQATAPLPGGRALVALGGSGWVFSTDYRARIAATPGLLSYWRLGESSGPTAADETGAHPGTYDPAVNLARPGALAADPNPAPRFSGTSGRVRVGPIASSTTFTIEGWSMLSANATENPNGNNALYGQWDGVRLLIRPNAVYGDVFANGAKEGILQPATASNIGHWVHWALVRNGSSLSIYRNGLLVASTSSVPSGPTLIRGSIGVSQPNDTSTPAYFMHGQIDEVAIYNQALSQATLRAHYLAAVN